MKPENNKENSLKCICSRCPLFSDCNKGKMENIFCARTVSECPMDQNKMCICGNCPLFSRYGLAGGYFCLNELK